MTTGPITEKAQLLLLESILHFTSSGVTRGPLYRHGAAQMSGAAGEQSRMAARCQAVLDSIGNIEDKAVTPVLTRLLGDIDIVALSKNLDAAAKSAEALGQNIL